MEILKLNKTNVLEAAQKKFQGRYIEIGECDLFLESITSGNMYLDGYENELFVNTNYVYEDRIVKGNKTRYKIQLTTVLLKKDAYEVIYDSFGKYFVAYKNEDTIAFIAYEDVNAFLEPFIHYEVK